MPIYQLPDEIIFPNPELAEEDGLLAVGGDLSFERLLLAYCNGIFPWYSDGDPILWWCPKPRFIIKPNEVKISKSMKRVFNSGKFKVTFDNDFEGVIRNCKELRENKEGTWINNDMMEAYINLFKKGFASSVEVYRDEKLIGGLYGVKIGKCFFGESMFSIETNASKVALISICKRLEEEEYIFLDCQMHTNHLESMGGKFVSWEDFKLMLEDGIN
ncbi:leucyl/phenylalanyl-tRNA--protein transferase [Clostridium sp. NSJ-6]|uniref:Leucyl/phenylalanyl-tRNA--protein transferase n=1 Tax=Clostridium hominis TaxID=2763036 RepID=A0ABR7DCD7_9CLOT|nr:leucyl/phenylalanyl-tRNA--protein transferase [Clostridium hominis]MBC5628790.1 leucyl/phenylalanyl-tRNA--protein transferase [Clostridium hominis]